MLHVISIPMPASFPAINSLPEHTSMVRDCPIDGGTCPGLTEHVLFYVRVPMRLLCVCAQRDKESNKGSGLGFMFCCCAPSAKEVEESVEHPGPSP
jgi:hypothetical protein